LAVIFLDLLWWRAWYPASFCALYFLYDYVSYRFAAILDFRASQGLRENITLGDIKKIENRYTGLDAFSTPEKRAMTRSPLDRLFYYERYDQAQKLLNKYAGRAERVLDLGCGFGLNTLHVCNKLGGTVMGLDLDHLKLIKASEKAIRSPLCKNIAFIAGDACRPPFKDASFDCIFMAEAIEHLIRPEKGIAACHDLLCDGGILILTTPSSHNLDYSCNPLIILEKTLSLTSDRLLPPYHSLHARFEYNRKNPEPQYGIHYHFSFQEMRDLLEKNRFRTIKKGSFEIEIPLFPIMELLFRGDLEMISRFVRPVENAFQKLPLVKHLGQHIIWVAQKIGDYEKGGDGEIRISVDH
jgi:SAM-dependent methyltransferase